MDNDEKKISREKFYFLIILQLINDKEFADIFYKSFDINKIKQKTGIFKIVFEAIHYIYNTTKDIPTKESLKSELEKLYEDAYHQIFSKEELNSIITLFCDNCRTLTINEEDKKHNYVYLLSEFKKIYTKNLLKDELQTLLLQENISPKDIIKKLQNIGTKISTLNSADLVPVFSCSFEDLLNDKNLKSRKKHGFFLIDHFCEGYEEGEVTLFIAPSGAGKTLICINSVVDSAKFSVMNKKDDELSVFIGYECPRHEALLRAWAASSYIKTNRLIEIKEGVSKLKSIVTSEEAEELFEKFLIKDGKSEKERIEEAEEFMKNVVLLDFSGGFTPDKTFVFGFGGVSEIVNVLETITYKTGKKIKYVAIDWVGLMLDRYLAFSPHQQGLSSSSAKSILLKNLIDEIISNIAYKFGCSVFVTHQLSGESMKKKPTQHYDMSDAADCKSLHVFTSFGLVMGNVSKRTRSALLGIRKSRKVEIKEDIIVTIAGEYGRIYRNNNMIVSYDIGEIIPKIDSLSLINDVEDPSVAELM